MNGPISVLLASADSSALHRLNSFFESETDFRITSRLLGKSLAPDHLTGGPNATDVLVLALGSNWQQELDALSHPAVTSRVPAIILSPEGDMQIMRRAMQSGARDFLSLSVDKVDLLKSIRTISNDQRRKAASATPGTTMAIINAKGGSGASFVAGSIATALAVMPNRKAALLDLDLQFGVQSLALDLKPKGSMLDALNMGEHLDVLAIEGFMSQHRTGLRLLGEYGEQLPLPWEIPRQNLLRLLQVSTAAYDHVIIDLPRQIDPLTTTVLDFADIICVVMHQSLPHVRDARRLIGILTGELAIPANRIKVVVNRYQAEAAVGLKDIKSAIDAEMILIPNDFRRASDAMNHGVPVHQSSPNAAISKALLDAASGLVGGVADKLKVSGLRGKIAGLFGQSTER